MTESDDGSFQKGVFVSSLSMSNHGVCNRHIPKEKPCLVYAQICRKVLVLLCTLPAGGAKILGWLISCGAL